MSENKAGAIDEQQSLGSALASAPKSLEIGMLPARFHGTDDMGKCSHASCDAPYRPIARCTSCHSTSHDCNASAFLAGCIVDWGRVPVCHVQPGLLLCSAEEKRKEQTDNHDGRCSYRTGSAPSDLTDRALVTAAVGSPFL